MIFSHVKYKCIFVLKYFEADTAFVFRVSISLQELLLEVDGDEVKVEEVLVLSGFVTHGTVVLCGDWPQTRDSSSLVTWGWTRNCL